MAQGDYWRLGVGFPIPNNNFELPQVVGLTLNGAVTSGATLIVDALAVPYDVLNRVVAVGDTVTVGPSTHANNPGATESFVLKTVTGTNLVAWANLTYDYEDGDPVSVVGSAWPGGWKVDNQGTISSSSIVAGYLTPTAFKAQWTSATATKQFYVGDVSSGSVSTLPEILPSTYYRIALWLKATTVTLTGTSFWARLLSLDGAGGWGIAAGTSNFGTQADWTEYTGTALSTAAQQPRTAQFSIEIGADTVPNIITADARLSNLVASHAKGTTTESVGYITFPEYPDFGTVNSGSRLEQSTLGVGARLYRMRSPFDYARIRKHFIAARYSDVSQTFIDDLRILLDYQEQGNPLVLWPFLNDVRHAMYGFLEVRGYNKDRWDWDSHSFTLQFTEM